MTLNAVKKEAMRIISRGLPAAEIAALESTFKAIDTDKSGTISGEELVAALKDKASLLKDEDWKTLMAAVKEAEIDYESFLAATLNLRQLEEQILTAFKSFDTDNSGTITREEISVALKKAGLEAAKLEAEVDAAIKDMDVDGNGVIDYKEFTAMLLKRT